MHACFQVPSIHCLGDVIWDDYSKLGYVQHHWWVRFDYWRLFLDALAGEIQFLCWTSTTFAGQINVNPMKTLGFPPLLSSKVLVVQFPVLLVLFVTSFFNIKSLFLMRSITVVALIPIYTRASKSMCFTYVHLGILIFCSPNRALVHVFVFFRAPHRALLRAAVTIIGQNTI